jgi:hypothetical protein
VVNKLWVVLAITWQRPSPPPTPILHLPIFLIIPVSIARVLLELLSWRDGLAEVLFGHHVLTLVQVIVDVDRARRIFPDALFLSLSDYLISLMRHVPPNHGLTVAAIVLACGRPANLILLF